MKPITNDEIEYASKMLFDGDPNKFYDDIDGRAGKRVDAIKCLESKNIVACPGSGKTTVLLAKLIILANRMPFEDGRGICVLTHTNVAIDLIKEKLGARASKLFSYPNFFGTIQSFVDRFLASPYIVAKSSFKQRPIAINNDFYNVKIDLYRGGILGKNANAFCYRNGRKNYPYTICWEDFLIDTDRKCKSLNLDLNKEDELLIFKKLRKLKQKVNEEGYFSFNDAFFVAKKYLSGYPNIIAAFSERFKFVFIDEMQDTATHQLEVLNPLFLNNENSISQEIGDQNQAIYDYDGQNGDWSPTIENSVFISNSKRYGERIASILNPFQIKPEADILVGENTRNEKKPYLFVITNYSRKYLENVLKRFGELIVANGLNIEDRNKFVAIGRVGKDKGEHITLKSYLECFEKKSIKKREYFNSFIEYFEHDFYSNGATIFKKLTNGILHFLEVHDFKHEYTSVDGKNNVLLKSRRYNKSLLFDFILKEDEELYFKLREKIAQWLSDIRNTTSQFDKGSFEDAVKFLSKNILPLKDKPLNTTHDFLKVPDAYRDGELKEIKKEDNIYTYKFQDGKSLDICFNTIHGEKGETHSATLYLETYKNQSYDSRLIKRQLLGKSPIKSDNEYACKMAYVAMSRPRDLLCFAVRKDSIINLLENPKHLQKLKENWEIEEI